MTTEAKTCSLPATRADASHSAAGFTLIELLVAVMILMLLISLLIVGLNRTRRSASILRAKGDLQSIAMALEQYRADFNSYPMYLLPPSGENPQPHRLAPALLGLGSGAGLPTNPLRSALGFCTVWDYTTNRPGGKIWPPYLSAEKFKVKVVNNQWELLDPFDQPIQYYPKRRQDPSSPDAAHDYLALTGPAVANNKFYRFDQDDGVIPINSISKIGVPLLQLALGDENANNAIDNGETLRNAGPFILASSGPDMGWADPGTIENSTARASFLAKTGILFNFDP